MGTFHSTEILVWNFRNSMYPMVHYGCTDQTQAIVHLVIVLVRMIQKSSTGDNIFIKWRGAFQSDRPKWPDRSKWTTFRGCPNILVGPNQNSPFYLISNRNFQNFGLNGKRPLVSVLWFLGPGWLIFAFDSPAVNLLQVYSNEDSNFLSSELYPELSYPMKSLTTTVCNNIQITYIPPPTYLCLGQIKKESQISL